MPGRSAEKSAYARALAGYDAWHFPHPGEPIDLDRVQRAENLAYFNRIKPARITYLRDAFPEIAPAIDQLLDPAQPVEPAIEAIERWWIPRLTAVDLMPQMPKMTWAARLLGIGKTWERHPTIRLQQDIYWYLETGNAALDRLTSFFADLGMVFGEAAVIRHPDFGWAINEERGDRRRQMSEWGRIVVFRPRVAHWPATSIDFVAAVRDSYERGIQCAWARWEWPPRPNRPGINAGWFVPGRQLANLVSRKMEPVP